MIISDMVEWNARRYPDKTALIYQNTRISFAELDNRTNSLIHGLWDMGAKKGDRVAILADTCHQYAEAILAIPKGGMIAVPLNYRFVPEELAYVVNDSGAQIIIVDDNFKDTFDSMRPYLKELKHVIAIGKPSPGEESYDKLLSSYPSDKPKVEVTEDDIAHFIYTSGTTALPKGVMRSHKSMMAAAIATVIAEKLVPEDICLLVTPPFHAGFLWPTMAYSYIGCTIVLDRWNPEDASRLIESEKVTFVILVPAMMRSLVDYPKLNEYDFSSLRRIAYGSSPVPEDLLKRIVSIFGNKFDQMYGSSEFGPPATVLLAENLDIENTKGKGRRLLSCGKEVVNAEARVIDENGNDVLPGQTGEIILKGDGIMSGYWNLPEKTAESLKGDHYYSGDMATVDEDGYIYVVDRKHDMIITGGENVYSPEVENAISAHSAVLEAAVIGIPDAKWGEAIKALVILRPGMTATENEIREFCRPRMAGYKVPKTVEFHKDFPRSALGKVSKKDLREQYWAGYERRVH